MEAPSGERSAVRDQGPVKTFSAKKSESRSSDLYGRHKGENDEHGNFQNHVTAFEGCYKVTLSFHNDLSA